MPTAQKFGMIQYVAEDLWDHDDYRERLESAIRSDFLTLAASEGTVIEDEFKINVVRNVGGWRAYVSETERIPDGYVALFVSVLIIPNGDNDGRP